MADKVLIKGGTVLSLDRAVGNLVDGDVLIEDGIITEVGPSLRARNAEVVDAADTIVMPGFVDTHRHLWQSLRRTSARRRTRRVRRGLSGEYTPDDIYAATLAGLLQALEAGITTVVDWCDVAGDAAHLEAALTAHADSGLRTVFVPSQPVRDAGRRRHGSRSPRPTSSRPTWTRSRSRWAPGPRAPDCGSTPTPARRRRRAARSPSWAGGACSAPTSRCPTAPA